MAAALLVNFLFWSGLAIGALVLAALVDVCGGEWLGPMRDTADACVGFLPVSFVALLALMLLRADVYPWARTPSGAGWFAPVFVFVRDAVVLLVLYASAFAYSRASRRARAAVPFLIIYAVAFSIIVVDLMMSLEPRWTSTLFPAYVFTGNVYAGTVALATISAWTTRTADAASGSRFRDAANLIAGLALFWLYLFWSQFLVIWYGNLTEEVGFLMARVGSVRPLGWIVLVLCWAAPSIALVPQRGKRPGVMRVVGIGALVGCWLERWLLVGADVPPPSVAAIVAVTIVFALLFAVSTTARHRQLSPKP